MVLVIALVVLIILLYLIFIPENKESEFHENCEQLLRTCNGNQAHKHNDYWNMKNDKILN